MNVGFLEGIDHFAASNSQKAYPDCFVFTDVDLIPEHVKNLHACYSLRLDGEI